MDRITREHHAGPSALGVPASAQRAPLRPPGPATGLKRLLAVDEPRALAGPAGAAGLHRRLLAGCRA
ncbi:hypothetical protein [Streptomyces flaveolus]|uniref:hypothetical protein n=1 Tax=Streptomyces flaveolus TaxID=67297 RepID=UPI0036FFC290